MAYFSNGCEGDSFYSVHCMKCVHEKRCMVWFLHLSHNYDQCAKTMEGKTHKEYLDTLIPDEGCTMFHAATPEEIKEMNPPEPDPRFEAANKPAPWIQDWLQQQPRPASRAKP